MTVAYLVSQYPAASHTFIRREVAALRSRGLEIQTFSIRRPSAAELNSARERAEFEKTFYLLPTDINGLVAAHILAVIRRPGMYARVLLLAVRHRVPGARAFLWSLFHFAEAIQLAREFERRKIQKVHNHFANSGATVGMLASQYLQLPWSLTLHGISETDYPAGLLLGAKIGVASFVACASEFVRAQAMRVCSPADWPKLRITPCGLDFSQLPTIEAESSSKAARLICVARFSPEKGHIGLLHAFRNALDQGTDAQLILVGDGPERENIEHTISDLNLQNFVLLQGILSEDAALAEIAASDALALASFMEGLPVVLMEAMALGRPVIAPRVAGIPELIAHEEDGLLFTPANWDDLTEQLSRLLNNSILRKRLGLAAKEKVAKRHNVTTAFDPLISWLSQKVQ